MTRAALLAERASLAVLRDLRSRSRELAETELGACIRAEEASRVAADDARAVLASHRAIVQAESAAGRDTARSGAGFAALESFLRAGRARATQLEGEVELAEATARAAARATASAQALVANARAEERAIEARLEANTRALAVVAERAEDEDAEERAARRNLDVRGSGV